LKGIESAVSGRDWPAVRLERHKKNVISGRRLGGYGWVSCRKVKERIERH